MDEPLLQVTRSGVSYVKQYLHVNHLYSVAAVTDASGAVVERYRYDAYGKRTVLDAAGLPKSGNGVTVVGFTGRTIDDETGLMYFRARQYSVTLGRFVGRDMFGSTNDIRQNISYKIIYNIQYTKESVETPIGDWDVEVEEQTPVIVLDANQLSLSRGVFELKGVLSPEDAYYGDGSLYVFKNGSLDPSGLKVSEDVGKIIGELIGETIKIPKKDKLDPDCVSAVYAFKENPTNSACKDICQKCVPVLKGNSITVGCCIEMCDKKQKDPEPKPPKKKKGGK